MQEIANVSPCAGCQEPEGECPSCKENKGSKPESKEDNEQMLETAKRAISDLDSEIKKLTGLRDTWVKCCGKIEGELYGRILP